MKKVRDHFFERAKNEGYAARSAYKLEEMDRKNHLLRKGMRVLDLGCAPGSWLQYIARRVLPGGEVIGVDLKQVDVQLPDAVSVSRQDVYELNDSSLLSDKPFDAILSDMAPNTTGIRYVDCLRSDELNRQALNLARLHLKPGGTLVVKSFQGEQLLPLRKKFQESFDQVKLFKPRSSRSESTEIYLLGLRKR